MQSETRVNVNDLQESYLCYSRALAEQSPYYESLKKRNIEVLFCYEPYDELVLMHLRQYKTNFLTSVEKEMRDDAEANKPENLGII